MLSDVVAALAFFGMASWVFGVHWDAFVTAILLIGHLST
jgi:hypothetical protein